MVMTGRENAGGARAVQPLQEHSGISSGPFPHRRECHPHNLIGIKTDLYHLDARYILVRRGFHSILTFVIRDIAHTPRNAEYDSTP
jgi:hypothetical protein